MCIEGTAFVGADAETIRRREQCYHQSVARAVVGLNALLVTLAYGGRSSPTLVADRK
ncbi:MAG: hypothetical protein JSR98_08590 [Proteobacteria bacterium]|nr:hypothetical protein [Pseudomonadota bacterium]